MGVKRSFETLLKLNQKDGFDCPSCAWPDPDGKRKMAEFCENGAKAVASEATTKRLTPEIFAKHSIPEMLRQTDMWLEGLGRITHPMIRRKDADHYEPISWEDAFELIGREIRSLASPDEASFYTSGRASNEAAFIYGLFARPLGTNNLPDCSNMCHESSGAGLTEVIGFGKATVRIEDFSYADAIFVIGQNPGTCHPRMLTELQKAARNGCRIVSINPLMETGLMRFKNPQSRLHAGAGNAVGVFVFAGANQWRHGAAEGHHGRRCWKQMSAAWRQQECSRHDFITHHTEGFEAFAADIKRESWERIVQSSGLTRDQIREAARIAIESERMICSWAMGITQHKNGVANVQSIANFALLRGQIGRRGAGVCPVRGHSNVQGDRTVRFILGRKQSAEFLKALGTEFNFSRRC